jgi:small subunit ribosomal protein S6
MRIYEELFILRPETTEEEVDAYVELLSKEITSTGGTVDKTDKWGVRKLAYRVEKKAEGYYVLIQFTAGPKTVAEVERKMRVTDMVMKFITVRIDERLKKVEKRRKLREKRAKRKPALVVTAPGAAPGAAPGTAPGAAPAAPIPAMPAAPAPGVPDAPVAEPPVEVAEGGAKE